MTDLGISGITVTCRSHRSGLAATFVELHLAFHLPQTSHFIRFWRLLNCVIFHDDCARTRVRTASATRHQVDYRRLVNAISRRAWREDIETSNYMRITPHIYEERRFLWRGAPEITQFGKKLTGKGM